MRNTFLKTLVECAEVDPRICLVVGDLGYSVVEPFRDRFGPRFLNAGVAEQNMTGVAAGMAMAGHKVFTYSIANFPTLRCLEQIRNDICYHGADVTVVAVGGGLAYGALGYSHHAVQDLACLRGFPGMLMATPGDPYETAAVTEYLCTQHRGPCYLRIGKGGEQKVHQNVPVVGMEPLLVRAGSEQVYLACGTALPLAYEAAVATGATLYSCPLWHDSSACRDAIKSLVARHRITVVVEEHLASGGFASFVREALGNNGSLQSKLRSLSLDSKVCSSVGSVAFLRGIGGLTKQALVELLSSSL